MGRNEGISASGNANVVGSAVASGSDSRATVRDSGLTQVAGGGALTADQIRELLGRLIDELRHTDLPERADLIEAAEDARVELESPNPRKGKLKVLAAALGRAVAGIGSLASLTLTIERAIHGL
jgi:hypothetical protein